MKTLINLDTIGDKIDINRNRSTAIDSIVI